MKTAHASLLVGVLLLSVQLTFAQETTSSTTAPRPIPGPGDVLGPPPVMAVDWSQKPKAWNEYQYSLKNREKWLKELPPGSATFLDIPYVDNPQQCASFPNSNQTLDLYVPPGDGPFPVVVYIHGGAWHGGCKEGEGTDFARHWLPEKLAVASIDYRFPPDVPFPGTFTDCLDAVAFLRAHAGQYHLDPKRFGVIGQSAGGHFAGFVAMVEGTDAYPDAGPALQAAVLRAGFFDLTKETGHYVGIYPGKPYDPEFMKKVSPFYLIHPGIPPVLIEHGDKDTTAPKEESEKFLAALQQGGFDATLTNYPDYNHGLNHPDVLAAELAFFKKCFAAVP